MSKKDLMREIKCLKDLGIEPDVAEYLIYKKYGYDDIADNSIQNWDEEAKDLKHNTYKYLVPFETTLNKQNDKDKNLIVLHPIKEDDIDKITS